MPTVHLASIMLTRTGRAEDVAADESSWVTGSDLVVDSGFSAR